MAGAGVTEAIVRVCRKKSLTYFQCGKIMVESEMEYRNPRVSMGISMSEYQIIRTNEEEVRKVCS